MRVLLILTLTGLGLITSISSALAANQVIYVSDFATDPNWQTDDSTNFYWDSATTALRARVFSQAPAYMPNRYFVTETDLNPTKSFTLEADIKVLEFAGDSVVTFGVFADALRSFNQIGVGGIKTDGTLNLELMQLGGSRDYWTFNIVDKNRANLGTGGARPPKTELDTWYHIKLAYDADTAVASLDAYNLETGESHRVAEIPGVQFNPDMRFVGVATHPHGWPRTAMANAGVSDYSEFLIDNVSLIQDDGIENETPQVSDLGQFKMFGLEALVEGETFIGNTAVFKAEVSDSDGDPVQLEVQLATSDGDGVRNFLSTTTASSSLVEITVDELIPKEDHYVVDGNEESFRWRARAVDSRGGVSDWIEFGDPGNIDFTARVVPLFTQRESAYPSSLLTVGWAGETYANGTAVGSCGTNIRSCACALSSVVMLAHYYGLDIAEDDTDIQPLNLNNWLLANDGYRPGGVLVWSAINNYTDNHLVYDGSGHWNRQSGVANTAADYDRLESYIADAGEPIPVIAHSPSPGHFYVIDSKVGERKYTTRDPSWYETKVLDEPEAVPQLVRQYNNQFDGLRVYRYHGQAIAYNSELSFALGSPAELLLTDEQGRKLGKDPRTGEEFTEIPEGYYYEEFIGDATGEIPYDPEPTKVLVVPKAASGSYTLEVIGTGNGPYTLSATFADTNGERNQEWFESSIIKDEVVFYQTEFDAESAEESDTAVETIESLLEGLWSLAAAIEQPGIAQAVNSHLNSLNDSIEKGKDKQVFDTLDQLMKFIDQQILKHITPTSATSFNEIMFKIKTRLLQ